MNVVKRYVVYELNKVMDSKKHLALQEVCFKGITSNRFKTEKDAIQALIDEEKYYENFLILLRVFIQS